MRKANPWSSTCWLQGPWNVPTQTYLGIMPWVISLHGNTTHPNCIHPSRQSPNLAYPIKTSVTSDYNMILDTQHINYSQCP